MPDVGATERVRTTGTTLSVTVSKVIDPLRGSGASLPPRTRAVGVLVQIRNEGSEIYDSSATGDISIVPSSGTATPAYAPRGTCQTPLQDFDNLIAAGETHAGCVSLALNTGARIIAVHFSPHARASGRVTWFIRSKRG